ncbi:MAG: aminotransferase class V-fold PLP-dependent enzyme, partial [Atopobium sp.]|nr:aminotransferase class V-fold PLP-dependent enzyme [Atopobium sp.]
MTDAEVAQITDNPYKADFPLLAANPEVAYLDSAATSQRPRAVIEAQSGFYETMNANALRGLYRWSVEATAAIEGARASIAKFIGAVDKNDKPESQQIIFTRNTSEALNLVASSLGCYA